MEEKDTEYLKLLLEPIRVCAKYKPRFGQGGKQQGLSLAQFQALYQSDPFYSWFGLDTPLMYTAHKAAGGITSVYRQIGIGCERLFRAVLRDALGLSDADVLWSYTISSPSGKLRTLHLDARVPLDKIADPERCRIFHNWMRECAHEIGVDEVIFSTLTGAVFEVRQGYKSKDSKRQNADIVNAAVAYTKAYLPCAAILSRQIDTDVLYRYKAEKWVVIIGVEEVGNPTVSTYDFMRDIIGYDLAAFFKRNSEILRKEIDIVLRALLAPDS